MCIRDSSSLVFAKKPKRPKFIPRMGTPDVPIWRAVRRMVPVSYTHLPSYDIEAARRLYRECRATLSGTFNSAFLDQAESKEEEDFYVAVSTFFLQKRQQELIEQGVF